MNFDSNVYLGYDKHNKCDSVYLVSEEDEINVMLLKDKIFPLDVHTIYEIVDDSVNWIFNTLICQSKKFNGIVKDGLFEPEIRLYSSGGNPDECGIFINNELFFKVNLDIDNIFELYTMISKLNNLMIEYFTIHEKHKNEEVRILIKIPMPNFNHDNIIEKNDIFTIRKCGVNHATISLNEPIILIDSDLK